MTRLSTIKRFLNRYFPNPKPPLHHKNAFQLLIATILSARCTDKKVNEITPLLFKKASTPKKMCKLSQQEIRKIIKPCGLSPQKAKAIYKLCRILEEKYHGRVPKKYEELIKLPGVGPKTAQVVLAQAFSIPAFPVDTHVARLAKRWKLSKGSSVKKIEEDLKKTFPKRTWSKVHLQMVLYGRKFCKSRPHKIQDCPICASLTDV